MNKNHPLLRCIILVYDFLRLLLLVMMVSAFAPAIGVPGDKVVPYLVLMTPHSLFFLASFFLWADLEARSAYISLYITGKIIGIGAFIAWVTLSWNSIIDAIGMNIREAMSTLGLTGLLLFADIGTIIGMCVLFKALKRMRKDVSVQSSPSGGL